MADNNHEETRRGAPQAKTPLRYKDHPFRRILSRLALDKGWNQSELGRAADIKRDRISAYMRGEQLPEMRNLKKLAEALGVDFRTLMPAYEGPIPAETIEEASVLEVRVLPGNPSRAVVRVSRVVSTETAFKIMQLINGDKVPDGE